MTQSPAFEYALGPDSGRLIKGIMIEGDAAIDAVVAILQARSPYNGDRSLDGLSEAEITSILFDQPSPVMDAVGAFDPHFEDADAIAIGAKGAMVLRIETSEDDTETARVLSNEAVRTAIDLVTGPYSEVVFPPIEIN